MTKSVTCPDELGALASQVTVDYSQLAVQGRLAAHTAEPEEVRRTLKTVFTNKRALLLQYGNFLFVTFRLLWI